MKTPSECNKIFLSKAQVYANAHSTCEKVKVGSLIISDSLHVVYGSNNGVCAFDCTSVGCHRVHVYGENSKLHRLPSDCTAIHSEVDAICKAAKMGLPLSGATIYVTRYPCEACARAIVDSGISKVVYGRKDLVSDMTMVTFNSNNVEVYHQDDWDYEDNRA